MAFVKDDYNVLIINSVFLVIPNEVVEFLNRSNYDSAVRILQLFLKYLGGSISVSGAFSKRSYSFMVW